MMKARLLLVLLVVALSAPPLSAQDKTEVADTSVQRYSPGKAFLRSVLLPGWGQFSVGAYKRGAVFMALQGSSYYMLAKSYRRLDEAEDRLDARLRVVRDSLIAEDDTVDLAIRLDTMSLHERDLVNSRRRHRQDWITYTVVFTLLSGVDAFVAAHLADFPARISTENEADGTVHLKVSVPFPARREH